MIHNARGCSNISLLHHERATKAAANRSCEMSAKLDILMEVSWGQSWTYEIRMAKSINNGC